MKTLFKIMFLFALIQIKPVYATENTQRWFVDEENGSIKRCLTIDDVRRMIDSLGQDYFLIIEDPGMMFSRSVESDEPFRWEFFNDAGMLDISRDAIIDGIEVRFHFNINPTSQYALRSLVLRNNSTCYFND